MKIPSIAFPKIVQTTGPDVLKAGYARFLNRNVTLTRKLKHDILSPGVHYSQDRQVRKYAVEETKHCLGQGSLGGTYDDIVDVVFVAEQQQEEGDKRTSSLNATSRNMTRRERVEHQSGIIHWSKEIYRNKKFDLNIPCMDHLWDAWQIEITR
jgi:hypothetical protein